MNKKEQILLQNFPKHQDNLKEQLKNDSEYAQMWLDSLLEDYSTTKDVNELIYNLCVILATGKLIPILDCTYINEVELIGGDDAVLKYTTKK